MTTEILKALDSVEAKFNSYQVEQRVLADRLLQIEQRGGMMNSEGIASKSASLGATVAAKFETLRDTYSTTKSVAFSVPLDLKSINAFTGSSIMASHATLPGLVAPMAGNASSMLIGNLPIRQTPGVATAHYSRYSTSSGSPGIQAGEGATKSTLSPDFLDISQNAITVAAICPISEQALKATGELESVVNGFLASRVLQAADEMLVGGTVVAAWPFAGYQPLATAYPSAYATISDAIADCVQNMRSGNGMAPDVVVINADTYLGIILLKNTGGDYLIPGALTSAPSDIRLHGCKVVFSSAAALVGKKALVIDSRQCELAMDGGMQIEIGHNSDDFSRNLRTIRVEMSVIPTYRMIGAARFVTTTPA